MPVVLINTHHYDRIGFKDMPDISQREVPDINEKSGTSCFVLVMMVFICAPSYMKDNPI